MRNEQMTPRDRNDASKNIEQTENKISIHYDKTTFLQLLEKLYGDNSYEGFQNLGLEIRNYYIENINYYYDFLDEIINSNNPKINVLIENETKSIHLDMVKQSLKQLLKEKGIAENFNLPTIRIIYELLLEHKKDKLK